MNTTEAYREKPELEERYEIRLSNGRASSETAIHWYLYAKKWSKLLVIFVMAGLAYGTVSWMNYQPVYHTNLLAASRYLSNEQVQGIINGVQRHLNNGDYPVVTKLLDMPEEQVVKIIALKCQYAPRNQDKRLFTLVMDISSNENYEDYQQKIFSYMENLEYVKAKIDGEKELIRGELANVINISKKLDNMESIMNQSIEGNKQKKNNPENEKLINESVIGLSHVIDQKLTLKKQQLELERQLAENTNFEIIRGFEKFSKPSEISILRTYLPPVLIALVFWGLVTWLLELNAEVKKRTRLRVK